MIIGSAQNLRQINRTSESSPCFQVNGNDIDLLHKCLDAMLNENLNHRSQAVASRDNLTSMPNGSYKKIP